ncbi:glutamine synthetase family protein [Falsirhodobacter sp. alg1]|uniref:glutamine synthetase family protein n=1 Tax=Falsirhodobacter sp. alg1 TaxID=1472418 RepID=UPI00192D1C30|nr:glutamine synthetase family protein [Falsirhodobacter sp. alg1]
MNQLNTIPIDMGFIRKHGLWTEQQISEAEAVLALVEEKKLRTIRVATADPQGKLRGKTLMPKTFRSAMKNGLDFTTAQYNFDSAEGIAYNPFTTDGGLGFTEMAGFPDVVLVPDPNTFKILPWCDRTGWILGDMYFHDGRPMPFDARHKLKAVEADMRREGYHVVAGLEIEFYVTRLLDQHLGAVHMGGLGIPPTPPKVEALWRGYAYQAEEHHDQIATLLDTLADHCTALGLPLRTMEDEMGPGQLEFTFDVQSGLEAADTMTLFRSMVKQVCTRMGYHATFMTLPGLPNFVASGWHLHQSLADDTGINIFAACEESGELLTEVARHYVGGLLQHAVEASVFTTPTVNGYKRRKPNSLAPDRSTWGYDNRAAMIRVQGGPGDPATHVENRVGEPTANPYLYIASQIASGLDGIRNRIDPGPLEASPYEATHRPLLPTNLPDAVEILAGSTFFKDTFGEEFIAWLIGIKKSEIARFTAAHPDWAATPEVVTEWEHREYFTRY